MNDRTLYIVSAGEENYYVELTHEQVRLMEWLNNNYLFCDGLEYLAVLDIQGDRP